MTIWLREKLLLSYSLEIKFLIFFIFGVHFLSAFTVIRIRLACKNIMRVRIHIHELQNLLITPFDVLSSVSCLPFLWKKSPVPRPCSLWERSIHPSSSQLHSHPRWNDYKSQHCGKLYVEITHEPLLFSVSQTIFWRPSERFSCSILHLIEGGQGSLYSCTL